MLNLSLRDLESETDTSTRRPYSASAYSERPPLAVSQRSTDTRPLHRSVSHRQNPLSKSQMSLPATHHNMGVSATIPKRKPVISEKWRQDLQERRPDESMFDDLRPAEPMRPFTNISCFLPPGTEKTLFKTSMKDPLLAALMEVNNQSRPVVKRTAQIGSLEANFEDLHAFLVTERHLSPQ